jgi:hypothetical protein
MKILAGISVLILISLGTWGYINKDTILKETSLNKTETPIVSITTTETLPNNNNTEESIDISVSTSTNTIDTYNWEKNLSNSVNKGKAELPTPILGGSTSITTTDKNTGETKTTVSTTATKPKISTPLKIVWDTIIGDKDKATTISSTPKSRTLDLGVGSSPLFHAPILGGGGSGSAPSTPATPVVARALNADCVMAGEDWWDTEIVSLAGTIKPADCSIVSNNPPPIFFPSISVIPWNINYTPWYGSAEEYTLTLTYPTGEVHTYNTDRNYYLLPSTLPVGGPYVWTVTASTTNTLSHVSVNRTSNPRRFYISSDSLDFVVPSMDTVVSNILAVSHPRSFHSGSEWDAIIASVQPGGSRRTDFNNLKTQVDTYDMTKVPPLADGTSIGAELLRIRIMEQLTSSTTYRDRIISLTNDIVTNWDATSGPTSFGVNDLNSTSFNTSLAKIYDLYYNQFSPSERVALLNSIKVRQTELYDSLTYQSSKQRYRPDSHGSELIGKAILVGLLTLGDIPEAETWVRELLPLYLSYFSPWGGEDGGFNQLGSYFDWDISSHGESMENIKDITGINTSNIASLRNFGYLKLYATPPGQVFNVFGDSHASGMSATQYPTRAQLRGHVLTYPPFYSYDGPGYLDSFQSNPIYKWMFVNYIEPTFSTNNRPNHILRKVDNTTPVAPSSLPTSALFPSIGFVGMHSSLTDVMRTSVYFKSSPLGNWSHAHADQNAFLVFSRGKPLAIESGFYGYFGEDWNTSHHVNWNKQTVANNAITIDNGVGQAGLCGGSAAGNRVAVGKITQFEVSGNNTYTTGDATEAYRTVGDCGLPDKWGKMFSKAIRSLVYLKDKDVVLVFDNLEASTSTHQWEWNIHSVDKMTINPDNSLIIDNEGIKLCVQVVGSNPLSLVQSNKFDPDQISASLLSDTATDTNAFDPVLGGVSEFEQWHARYYTPSVYQTSFAAVLKINCDTNTTNVGLTQIDSHTWRAVVDGQTITFDGTQIVR